MQICCRLIKIDSGSRNGSCCEIFSLFPSPTGEWLGIPFRLLLVVPRREYKKYLFYII